LVAPFLVDKTTLPNTSDISRMNLAVFRQLEEKINTDAGAKKKQRADAGTNPTPDLLL
jgi:hypothetical protein